MKKRQSPLAQLLHKPAYPCATQANGSSLLSYLFTGSGVSHKKILWSILLLLFITPHWAWSQCISNTQSGAFCSPRSGFYAEEYLPNNGTTFVDYTEHGTGEYFRMPVLAGGCYSISTCGAGFDSQITAYQGTNTTTPFAWNDDNG
ncbi:MAG TPA: hypothetical protein VJ953_02215, partial [Saprospiraceae bacterium]|nr:hypothetical protein [Saprospiraceae bacterium]